MPYIAKYIAQRPTTHIRINNAKAKINPKKSPVLYSSLYLFIAAIMPNISQPKQIKAESMYNNNDLAIVIWISSSVNYK